GLQNLLAGKLTSLSYTDANADYNGDGVINKNDAVALWGYALDSFYGQDTWSPFDNLTLIAGVRYDRYSQSEKPTFNSFFQQRYGYANTKNIDGLDIILPRFAFNWKADQNTEINGGVGLFSGGGPNVWISNVFSNDGVRTSNIFCSRNTNTNVEQVSSSCPVNLAQTVLNLAYPSNAVFDVNPQLDQQIQGALVNGVNGLAAVNNTNNISPSFQVPSQWRSNVEITHAFYLFNQPNPWVFNAGVLYGKVKAESAWRDLRGGLTPIGTAPDGRPIYNGPGQRATLINTTETIPAQFIVGGVSTIRTDAGNDIELFSAHSGHTVAYTVGLAKTFDNGFDFDISYTGTQSTEAQPALSSVAFSNWSNWATADSNNPVVATSNNEVRDSYKADVTWHHAFFGDNDTAITMFAEYRSGFPFSLTFQPVSFAGGVNTTSTSCANGISGTSACNLVYFGDGGSGTRPLFYVPTGPNDPKVAYPGPNGAATAAALDAFINSFQSLRDFRGHIASRNAFVNPDVFRVDMRFTQELPAFFPGGAKLIGYLDIKNVLNLVNNSWGLVKAVDFPSTAPIVDVALVNGVYQYSNFRRPNYVFNSTGGGASSANRSQWQIKFGAKYKF
ncbi:MAG: TonB-dependent receptor, partial [Alphaproteobacteria bacterium]